MSATCCPSSPKAAAITRSTSSRSTGCSGRTSKPMGPTVARRRTVPHMDIASLAFRTDLAMLEHSGSVVEDRGSHLVVRTPDNPTYWWGNFLLLATAPEDVDEGRH